MQLALLGTTGCHLCDIAERMVRRIAPALGFSLVYVDIADDDILVDQYGMQIPILRTQNGHELGWPFTEDELIHWLEALNV
ncbi:glutaredoxin family protein [Pseudomonas sp. HK3]